MSSFVFGAGNLTLIPLASATATPLQFKSLQEFSVDFKFDDKSLHGQNQFALDIARGKGSIDLKFKNAGIRGGLFNSAFFGDTATTGQVVFAPDEAGTVPAVVTRTTSAQTTTGTTLTFTATTGVVDGVTVSGTNIAAGATVASHDATTVTLSTAVAGTVANSATITFGPSITVSNSATFSTDCGVVDALTGLPLTKVSSSPATGGYSVSAVGVYTFAADDANMAVLISYTYTTSGSGNKTTITNKLMGTAPKFKMIYSNRDRDGNPVFIQFNSCMSNDMKMAGKNEDYIVPEFSAKVMVDSAGNIGILSFPE